MGLASVTTLVYDGDRGFDVEYSPAGADHVAAASGGAVWYRWRWLFRTRRGRPGGTFEFVSPGGKTDIFYDPPASRGSPGPLSGPDLADPADVCSKTGRSPRTWSFDVWGQWCGPCRAEDTQLQRVFDANRGSGVFFLGIDVRDKIRQAAQDFVDDHHVTDPSIYDLAMRTLIAFGGRSPPP